MSPLLDTTRNRSDTLMLPFAPPVFRGAKDVMSDISRLLTIPAVDAEAKRQPQSPGARLSVELNGITHRTHSSHDPPAASASGFSALLQEHRPLPAHEAVPDSTRRIIDRNESMSMSMLLGTEARSDNYAFQQSPIHSLEISGPSQGPARPLDKGNQDACLLDIDPAPASKTPTNEPLKPSRSYLELLSDILQYGEVREDVVPDDELVEQANLLEKRSSTLTLAERILEAQPIREEAWGGAVGLSRGVFDTYAFFSTIFKWEARAMRNFGLPWLVCTLWGILWTGFMKFLGLRVLETTLSPFLAPYSFLLTAVGFMLVFRLNRSAIRYWDARLGWGIVVNDTRLLIEGACTHLKHNIEARDAVVSWTLAFAVGCKALLQGVKVDPLELSGVISLKDVEKMNAHRHPPLYCTSAAREALLTALGPASAPPGASFGMEVYRATTLSLLQQNIFELVRCIGMMERIKSTPLPLVYVTHARTILFIYLLLMPLVYSSFLGWGTPFVVMTISFFLLGVEGAATECVVPFQPIKKHINHVRQEAVCKVIFDCAQQIVAVSDSKLAKIQ